MAPAPAAEPVLNWWDTGDKPPRRDQPSPSDPVSASRIAAEPTPIFDSMVSAWFAAPDSRPSHWPNADPDSRLRRAAPASAANGQHRGDPDGASWESAADDGWQAARALSAAAPSDYTTAGLPRRNPRQSLLPGSVADPRQAAPAAPRRDATEVRGRLSSLRDGLSRGRHSIDARPPGQPA